MSDIVELTWVDITQKEYSDNEDLPSDWSKVLTTVKEYGYILHRDRYLTVLVKETHDGKPNVCLIVPNSNIKEIRKLDRLR